MDYTKEVRSILKSGVSLLFPYEHTVRYETVARVKTEARIGDALIEGAISSCYRLIPYFKTRLERILQAITRPKHD